MEEVSDEIIHSFFYFFLSGSVVKIYKYNMNVHF